jgi:hypothetical protein
MAKCKNMNTKKITTFAKSGIDFISALIKFFTPIIVNIKDCLLLTELIDLRGLKILMMRSDLRFKVPKESSTNLQI